MPPKDNSMERPLKDYTQNNSTREWAKEQTRIDMKTHAHGYIRKGWAIVPLWWPKFPLVCACSGDKECTDAGKHPIKTNWTKEPLRSALEVDLWWDRYPLANIGVVTGKTSGLVVLDIDPQHGGWQSYNRIVRKYGGLPHTIVSITGSNGRHVLFKHPMTDQKIKNVTGHLPGIDIRGDGGQIVAPPSMHKIGARYFWHKSCHPRSTPIAEMPEWMFTLLKMKKHRMQHQNNEHSAYGREFDLNKIPPIPEGGRNDGLCSIVGRLIWDNRSEEEIAKIVHRVNDTHCNPPLSRREVDKLIRAAIHRWY